ncbi:Hypothetical predicted protein [Mytilus galloprovincialis]|nr:Hypothetical predicted protein [Mytilus galloprovincialis]
MYIATKYHVYLKEITIIIPSTWSNNGAYSYISSSIAKNAHVKIGEYPDYKSPFARTYGKCGKEGLFIHFTTDLVKAGDSGGYGNLGKVFSNFSNRGDQFLDQLPENRLVSCAHNRE